MCQTQQSNGTSPQCKGFVHLAWLDNVIGFRPVHCEYEPTPSQARRVALPHTLNVGVRQLISGASKRHAVCCLSQMCCIHIWNMQCRPMEDVSYMVILKEARTCISCRMCLIATQHQSPACGTQCVCLAWSGHQLHCAYNEGSQAIRLIAAMTADRTKPCVLSAVNAVVLSGHCPRIASGLQRPLTSPRQTSHTWVEWGNRA